MGKVSKVMNSPQILAAQVRNGSNAALSNVVVKLDITGVNPFTDSQTLTTIAAGAVVNVPFLPYNPTTNGLSVMTVTVPSDQINTNNTQVWTQSVTCNEVGYNPPLAANQFTSAGPYQYASPGGIYSYRYSPPVTTTITGIRLAVSTATNVVGTKLWGVLESALGVIIATTNTITMSSGDLGNWVTFNFATPQQMTMGTNYNIGVAQPDYPCQAFAAINIPGDIPLIYLQYVTTGGAYTGPVDRGYMGIEAVLATGLTVTAVATKTAVCKSSPLTVTLTAGGAQSYTWSGSIGTGSQVAYTPTAGVSASVVAVSVTGGYTTGVAAGCKSSPASITFSLAACTGINDNSGADAIRIFPNPAIAGKITISNLTGANEITVYNTLGQTVLNRKTENDIEILDLSSHSSGNYMIKVTDSNNESRLLKLVIQN